MLFATLKLTNIHFLFLFVLKFQTWLTQSRNRTASQIFHIYITLRYSCHTNYREVWGCWKIFTLHMQLNTHSDAKPTTLQKMSSVRCSPTGFSGLWIDGEICWFPPWKGSSRFWLIIVSSLLSSLWTLPSYGVRCKHSFLVCIINEC